MTIKQHFFYISAIITVICLIIGSAFLVDYINKPKYYPQAGDFVKVIWEPTLQILGFYGCDNRFIVIGIAANGTYILKTVGCDAKMESRIELEYIEPM